MQPEMTVIYGIVLFFFFFQEEREHKLNFQSFPPTPPSCFHFSSVGRKQQGVSASRPGGQTAREEIPALPPPSCGLKQII